MSILVLTSDTLIGTPATGNLEYNGQFYGTDSNASRAQMQRLVLSTAVAYTSFTTTTYNDFLNIPAWVKRITVMFDAVSTNGSSLIQIQVGSGSIVTTGYASQATASAASSGVITSGLCLLQSMSAATANTGQIIISLMQTNRYVMSSTLAAVNGTQVCQVGGGTTPTLSGALDRIRITTVNGTDTFDNGTVNILYEG